MFVREKEGLYWTVLMPAFIYIALAVLPLGQSLGGNLKYSSYVLPGIIAMTIMQGGIYSLAYWMVDLKTRGIVKRLMATPIKEWQLATSLVLSRLVIVLVQVIILTLLGILLFHATFAANIVSVIILVFLGGSIFLLVGLLISNYAHSYDSAAPITSAIGLPLTFLGNIFYPVSALPYILRVIANLLPITYLADGLRQTYLYPFNFAVISKDIFILLIWFVILLVVIVAVFRLRED